MGYNYIVLLNRYGTPMFLKDDCGDPIIFTSEDEAEKAANNNSLGEAAGYQVVKLKF